MKKVSDYNIFLKLGLSFLFLSGCSLIPKKGENIKVNSEPQAEVILGDGAGGVGKSLGRTPLTVNFKDHAQGKDLLYLKFVAEKREDYQMVLPSTWTQGELNVKLKKKEKILPSEVEEKMVEKMRDLSTSQVLSVLSFQKQLQQGDFSKASSEVVNLKRLRTPAAVVSMLEGNLNYIKGNKRAALNAYKRSYSLYPKNYEIKTLINKLESEIGR